MRVVHLSDPHLLDLHGVRWTTLLKDKRVTGLVNLVAKRRRAHRASIARDLARSAGRIADHAVITGDLTNLALEPEIDKAAARAVFERPLDLLALANPTVVRIFAEAITALQLDPERCLAGVTVAAVGPATAATAQSRGLVPDVVAGGRLKALIATLLAFFPPAPPTG